MRRSLICCLLLTWCCATGCRETQTKEEMHEVLQEFGRLPGLRQSTHDGLRDELARIEEEGGTPVLLISAEPPDENNVAVALKELFTERKLSTIYETSSEIYPADGFRFDSVALQRAIDFKDRYAQQLRGARQALARTQCSFGIGHDLGFAADTSFVELVRICGRLEAFAAAELLDTGRPDEALRSLANMLSLARRLGAEKHAVSRLEAAYLRAEAWDVLAAIALHRETTDAEVVHLEEIVRDHLAVWPDDRNAWIGDRATGLHTYEMIRGGYLQSVLTVDELQMFADEGIGGELAIAVHRHLDEDQLYYLTTMRRFIDGCKKPYADRIPLFQALRDDLQAKKGQPDFPFIAGRLLLIDIQRGHRIQAADRALAEGWALALALAVGREAPYQQNPLTGRPYQVAVEEYRVVVWDTATLDLEGDRRMIVPRVAP